MTQKVFQKCKQAWSRDIDTHIAVIRTYDNDSFYPIKVTEEWTEDTITFHYVEYYGYGKDLQSAVYSISIPRKYIKEIIMYNNYEYLHRRCKRYHY